MNVISGIASYKHLGMWVFDDPPVGQSQEPFVAGAGAVYLHETLQRLPPNARRPQRNALA